MISAGCAVAASGATPATDVGCATSWGVAVRPSKGMRHEKRLAETGSCVGVALSEACGDADSASPDVPSVFSCTGVGATGFSATTASVSAVVGVVTVGESVIESRAGPSEAECTAAESSGCAYSLACCRRCVGDGGALLDEFATDELITNSETRTVWRSAILFPRERENEPNQDRRLMGDVEVRTSPRGANGGAMSDCEDCSDAARGGAGMGSVRGRDVSEMGGVDCVVATKASVGDAALPLTFCGCEPAHTRRVR